MNGQPFPMVAAGSVTPDPSRLWAAQIRRPPLPTNSGWLNFVLNQGNVAEYLHPYAIQSWEGKLVVSYPPRAPNPDFIFQAFIADLSVWCREEGSAAHVVSHFDDLSVTLDFGSRLSVPLVRGSPYVTFLFKNGTPAFSTIHAVLGLESNSEKTRHKLVMNNGQTWVIYASSALPLGKDLSVNGVFTGVVRVAVVPPGDGSAAILDRYSTCYPVGGVVDFPAPFQVRYSWKKQGWGDLLLLTLPYHRDILADGTPRVPTLSYTSIDGPLQGVVGDSWVLREKSLAVSWHSSTGVRSESAKNEITAALNADVAALKPIASSSTYYQGKGLARAARLALIAEEVGSSDSVKKVHDYLVNAITPWFTGTYAGNALVYDVKWGGLVSRAGAGDPGADFGLAMYNDHHYHFGYFCYAGAVLAKLDPVWGRTYKNHLYALVKDYMNINFDEKSFPRMRCFDPYKLHSWAGGLTEFADGRNQESTSEAVNAYYAAALLGLAFADPNLINVGLTLTALEIRVAKSLWHVRKDSTLYEADFVSNNRVMGVLWANKRDSGLWFAPKDFREMRLGIQVLPLSPVTEALFDDQQFTRELVEWAVSSLSRGGVTDAWRGFVYALLAVYQPQKARESILQLSEPDDGNSRSNLLWWVNTRPGGLNPTS